MTDKVDLLVQPSLNIRLMGYLTDSWLIGLGRVALIFSHPKSAHPTLIMLRPFHWSPSWRPIPRLFNKSLLLAGIEDNRSNVRNWCHEVVVFVEPLPREFDEDFDEPASLNPIRANMLTISISLSAFSGVPPLTCLLRVVQQQFKARYSWKAPVVNRLLA